MNATLTGFIIAMILVAMFGAVFGTFITQMNSEYGMTGDNQFSKYKNYTDDLELSTETIKNETDITQQDGILDVIGGYFSGGYAALKTSATSIGLFRTMMDDATGDVPELAMFKTYLFMIILVLIFVGVVIAVLVKMRI